VPDGVELALVESAMREHPLVEDVHDLHVWAMTSSNIVLSAHVVLPCERSEPERLETVKQLKSRLHDQFGVEHATIETETTGVCTGLSCDKE